MGVKSRDFWGEFCGKGLGLNSKENSEVKNWNEL